MGTKYTADNLGDITAIGSLTIGSAGQFTVTSAGDVTAPLFTGPLTGHASLDLPLTGGTLSGTLIGNMISASTFVGTTFSGNGAGLTSLTPGNISAGTANINISGNAATATTSTTASSVAASSLTGTTLASNVVTSSLTSVGTLSGLTISGTASATTFAGALTGSATAVGGITVTGTPSLNQVLTATSGTAADWQTPSSAMYTAGTGLTLTGLQFSLATPVSIANGGTGANTAPSAQVSLNVPSTSGMGATGTWGINITGNAATATTATSATTAATATTANALNSSTTTVVVSGATAPTNGQVLTASSGTLASWVSPVSGGISALTGDVTASGSGSVTATAAASQPNITTFTNASGISITDGLNVGSSQFQVNSSGNITKINNVTTSFPASQGSAGQVLTDSDGAGTLTWTTPSGSGSSGASGSVQLSNGSGGFTSDASNFYWNTTTHQLGIGTTSTLDFLDVLTTTNQHMCIGASGIGPRIYARNATGSFISGGIEANPLYINEYSAGNVVIGQGGGSVTIGTTTSTASLFNVGSSNQFQVNSTGNVVKLNNVTTSFPSSQGSSGQVLTNSDGAGTLTWSTPSGSTYTAGTGLTLTSNQFSLTVPVSVADGGTGATTPSGAATNLSVLPISGGSLTGAIAIPSGDFYTWTTAGNQIPGIGAVAATNGPMVIQCYGGTGAVEINPNSLTGTGGLAVFSGGVSPVFVGGINGSGVVSGASASISGAVAGKQFTDTIVTGGSSGSAVTVNWAAGAIQTYSLTANCTFTMSGAAAGQTVTLFITQGSGAYTATWSPTANWPSSTAPTITTTSGKVDVISFFYDGSNYWGFVGGQNYP